MAWEGIASRYVQLVEGLCVYIGKFLFIPQSEEKGRGVGVQRRFFSKNLHGFYFNGGLQQFLLSLLLIGDFPLLLGTFALTSLISANAVERLVLSSSQNLTTQSNTSVLGLSDFEMQRIGIAAAVSFLGGLIQVSSTET